MRVIAGKARGRTLKMVPGEGTRPITDRVKESVFGIVQPGVVGSRWLDLFGGTGAVGIEALSRGAREVVFVELDRRVLGVLRENVQGCGLLAGAQFVQGDAFRYLAGRPSAFDYIYVAPPQYQGLWVRVLDVLAETPGWLSADGEVVVQVHPRELKEAPDFETRWGGLELLDERRYGSTVVLFYGRAGEAGEG